ncbi:GNAT family N-acetyltransferase [Devosia sp.]|uniref:GNAT family N-acetyltransferase n=1 Tax=Devosia sp. TaxID=1871048 RepID=UPI0035B44CEE
MIPTLETERLILRPHRLADFDAYVEMWADPDVVRFIGGKPFDRESSWSRFLRHFGVWQLMGFGFFAIEEKETGHFVGEAGFHDLRRNLVPSLEGTLEAGWALNSGGQGWGYATEAMSAAIGWAGTAFAGQRMTCIINPDNLPSIRVAGRLGFTELARTSYFESPIVVFERRSA